MTTPVFNIEKSLQSILYVAKKNINRDFHQIFKILYFADREHAYKYGRFITGDTYIRMDFGPVPSAIYDLVKCNKRTDIFNIKGYVVVPATNANMSLLSVSDVKELDEAIEKYGNLSMSVLTELSHGYAWNSASKNGYIFVEDILKEAGADDDYIHYVCEHIALQKSVL
ncbi:MAG: Panacea domain-containing protein [Bacteroidetes bacterium]|nr:Panacea domain-containing protein [Bacteroidota bacterium]